MREDTKLARIRDAMRANDWNLALRLAARFQRLGPQAVPIRRAADAIENPSFYQELGYDLVKVRSEGISALRERFSKSWKAVKNATRDHKKRG